MAIGSTNVQPRHIRAAWAAIQAAADQVLGAAAGEHGTENGVTH